MADAYSEFWAASGCTSLTSRLLGERLRDWTPPTPTVDPLSLPSTPHRLDRPADDLQRLLDGRHSTRAFGPGALPADSLSALLAAVAERPGGGRPHPSAGALNPLRCYAFLLSVDHPLDGRVVRHDPVAHTVQDAGPCPQWTDLAALLGVAPGPDGTLAADSRPQLVLALLLDDAVMLDKYGQRGGRFGLVEVGCAAQSLALRLAADGLGGHLVGGAADRELLAVLGLRATTLRVGAVLACGRPAQATAGTPRRRVGRPGRRKGR